MPFVRALTWLRAIACLLCLSFAAPHVQAASLAPIGLADVQQPARLAQEEESCGRGKATKEFGWKVVDFGVSTLKYLIGLFIIPIGFFLVIVGALLQMVEAVAC